MAQDTKKLTWQQKIEQGVPLNNMDEIKADADFNYTERVREQTAREEFEKRKNGAGRVEAKNEGDATPRRVVKKAAPKKKAAEAVEKKEGDK